MRGSARVLLLLVSLLACLPRCATAADALKIATWNIEHLAEREGDGCRPRTHADYAVLRTYADRIDADVIAFQEVESERAAARVFDPLKYRIIISRRPDHPREETCRKDPSRHLRKQDVGFAIRRGVEFHRNDDYSALGMGNPDMRWGVDVTLLKPMHVRLLAIHLKSGCPDGGTRDACSFLFSQLPVLKRWIDARAKEGLPFVVLGDLNRKLGKERDSFWQEIDDGDPPDAELSFPSGGYKSACKQKGVDHFILDRRAAHLLLPGSLSGLSFPGVQRMHPSDHCPLFLEMRKEK